MSASLPSSPSDRIARLVDQAFADLENDAVPLSDVVAKATRIARLRGDFDNLHWLEMELRPLGDDHAKSELAREFGAHYTEAELSRRNEAIAEAYIAERTADMPADPSGTVREDKVLGIPVREIEDRIKSVADVARGPDVPRGMHTHDLQAAHEARREAQMIAADANGQARAVLARIEHRVHEFLSATEKQLLYGQVNADIFERNRAYVDGRLAVVAPAALGQITSAYRRAREGDDEARSQALLSCRRALKSLADVLYPARNDTVTDSAGREHKLTDDKWRNRLLEFAKGKLQRSTARDLLQTQLDELDRRLRALSDSTSSGVHSAPAESELDQTVIQAYLTIGDLLRLHAEGSGPPATKAG